MLGEFLQAKTFQNAVVTALEDCGERFDQLPGTLFVMQVFEDTPEDRPLRQWTVDHFFAYSGQFRVSDSFPPQFMMKLVQKYQEQFPTKSQSPPDFCKRYHAHSDGQECGCLPRHLACDGKKRKLENAWPSAHATRAP